MTLRQAPLGWAGAHSKFSAHRGLVPVQSQNGRLPPSWVWGRGLVKLSVRELPV